MKKAIPLLLIFCLLLCTCDQKAPTTPDLPSIPECERHNTATVQFENRSNSNTTYDVIWDGSKRTTIAPGTKSQIYTEAAGQHSLHFKITNTNWSACTPSSPVLAQCSEMLYWCTY